MKMDIPDDIRQTALAALEDWYRRTPDDVANSVARALLSERLSATERAAKQADEKAAEYEAETDMWSCAAPIAVRLRGLAAAIRSGA
jgi:hypothetical protein